jgi:hypothetical protein
MSDFKEENSFDGKEDLLINEKNTFVRRKNLSVNFSPIVKIIKIESFKKYNKIINKKYSDYLNNNINEKI